MTLSHFDTGENLFAWTAHDYHPHERGLLWHIVFVVFFFGGALWAALVDPQWGWVTSVCLCVIAGLYLLTHRKGSKDHEVQILEKGLLIDEQRFIGWEKMSQFWFVYDETVSMIKFDFKKENTESLTLQMGQVDPTTFRDILAQVSLPEAEDREESALDLWIRVLKL